MGRFFRSGSPAPSTIFDISQMLILLISIAFFASVLGRHFTGHNSTAEARDYFLEILSIASLNFIKFLLIILNFREEIICQPLGWSMEILQKDDISAKIMFFVSTRVSWEYAFHFGLFSFKECSCGATINHISLMVRSLCKICFHVCLLTNACSYSITLLLPTISETGLEWLRRKP